MVPRGSVMVRRGSVMVRRGSVMVRRGSVMVRRGSVGSASACWKAGPSSILGLAPQGGLSHWAVKRWGDGDGEWPRRMYSMNVIGWLYVINMKNKQKEWHTATKPFPICCSFMLFFFLSVAVYFDKVPFISCCSVIMISKNSLCLVPVPLHSNCM